MGIVNINGDSFFSGSRVAGREQFTARVAKLFAQGADVVDIGACSSRPGSIYEGEDVEWSRLEPVLQAVREDFSDKSFSIDTFSSKIVRRVYDIIGPFMVNDISAGQSDAAMLPTVASLQLQYVAMHNLNPPRLEGVRLRKMIRAKEGENIVDNVARFFRAFEKRAAAAGISEWILDPGFGFGKDVDENLELLEHMDSLKLFGREILAGISRKRMTYEKQGRRPEDDETLEETRRLQQIAIEKGASWIRCHDV